MSWLCQIFTLFLIILAWSCSGYGQVRDTRFKPVSARSSKNSPYESARKKWFGSSADKDHACRILTRGVRAEKLSELKSLQAFIDSLKKALSQQDAVALRKLFHPKLRVGSALAEKTLVDLNAVVGTRHGKLSLMRVWALNTVDGTVKLTRCEKDKLHLRPLYGYPLQAAVRFQITGKVEIARPYASVVPLGGRWYLGSWHQQQWTHNGRDPEHWIEAALEDKAANRNRLAYAKLDIAAKLLSGGAFIYEDMQRDAEATRDALMSQEKFNQAVKKQLGSKAKLAHVGTGFGEGGVYFVLRLRVNPLDATDKHRQHCREAGRQLFRAAWTKGFAGIRCGLLGPKEDPKSEGPLGGIDFRVTALR